MAVEVKLVVVEISTGLEGETTFDVVSAVELKVEVLVDFVTNGIALETEDDI